MRLASLPAFAVSCAFSAVAYAGSASTDAPNPFTDQASPSAALDSAGQIVGVQAAPAPSSITPPTQPDNLAGPSDSQDSTINPGNFYQASKRDTDSR